MRRAWRMAVVLMLGAIGGTASHARADGPDVPEEKSWAFDYNDHGFAPGSLTDLRSLNEPVAGAHGYIRLSADGQGFVRGDGQPIRFWAINAKLGLKPDQMEKQGRYLASLGVNLARIFVMLPDTKPGSKMTDVDPAQVDEVWQAEAAFKKAGIYSLIVPVWPTSVHPPASWGIEANKGSLGTLLFFDPQVQDAYKAWVKQLYSPKNPYTGIPLAQDPAVAIIQVLNEDSIFFYTSQGLQGADLDMLEKQFADWLTKKYGSLAKATARWTGASEKGDDFASGKVGLMIVWKLGQPQAGGARARATDQTEFFAETQRNFYADVASYYHNALRCHQLTNAANWITANSIILNDAERWTYQATDIEAVNHYYSAVQNGIDKSKYVGWRIDPGDVYTDPTATTDVRNLPCNFKQVVGHPFMVTESTWVSPISHQTEGPPLMAAYQSLTGMNVYFWFCQTAAEYDNPFLNFVNEPGGHAVFKWTCSKPEINGMFPAAALIYRKGYIQQGATPAIHEERSLADMWSGKAPIIAEDVTFDPNRWAGKTGSEESNIPGGINPLAYLVGRVEVKYGGIPSRSSAVDFSKYIDSEHKIIHSITGQITMDYGKGLCLVNAPSAVEAIGSLNKGGDMQLGPVTLKSGNDYGSITIVPLDGAPIASSAKVLVQVGTWGRPTGWTTEPTKLQNGDEAFRIVTTGQMPERLLNTDVTISIRNPRLTKAILLDTAGYPGKKLAGKVADGAFTLTLPADAMYVVLE